MLARLLAAARTLVASTGLSYSVRATPTTPKVDIPPDRGDAGSAPSSADLERMRAAHRAQASE